MEFWIYLCLLVEAMINCADNTGAKCVISVKGDKGIAGLTSCDVVMATVKKVHPAVVTEQRRSHVRKDGCVFE